MGVCGLLRWSEITHAGRKGSEEKLLKTSALSKKKKVYWLKLKNTKAKMSGDSMTIDFHPSPQDLDDQAKFSVKQYSVTLPPMDETYYKSHTELLDDLLIQRMRQDFQIVPRNIIQQNARRDVADNGLEATLSMGHKIQRWVSKAFLHTFIYQNREQLTLTLKMPLNTITRLSYNTSTDSVDVVQYYARFAEDEIPQTYHYHLWSALRQVSLESDSFLFYSSPYS